MKKQTTQGERMDNIMNDVPMGVVVLSKHLKILSWIASLLTVVGTLLNAYMIIWCWPSWVLGSMIWVCGSVV